MFVNIFKFLQKYFEEKSCGRLNMFPKNINTQNFCYGAFGLSDHLKSMDLKIIILKIRIPANLPTQLSLILI